MKIRSITYFCDPGYPLDEQVFGRAAQFLDGAKKAYEAEGYEVQTTRVATTPFPQLLGEGHISQLPGIAQALTKTLAEAGLAYASLGPAMPLLPASYAVIPEAIAASENIFFGGMMTGPNGIDLQAVAACARVIVQCATLEANGFANLRFAALANVEPGAPFLPAAYHLDRAPAFAIATEAADLAVSAFQEAGTLEAGSRALTAMIEDHGQRLARIANTQLGQVSFGGIDFSLAPFPDDAHSLGNAVERMGVEQIGLHGSTAAAAILTQAIEAAQIPHTGFSGFMQPILEDSILSRRAAEGVLTIKDALLYSTVCGTGLDTVPLPGDTTAEQLMPLLLDLCALALRLDKPLTARLMPIPGKAPGDPTEFDFGFFANSRVMTLDSLELQTPLSTAKTIELKPRKRKSH